MSIACVLASITPGFSYYNDSKSAKQMVEMFSLTGPVYISIPVQMVYVFSFVMGTLIEFFVAIHHDVFFKLVLFDRLLFQLELGRKVFYFSQMQE